MPRRLSPRQKEKSRELVLSSREDRLSGIDRSTPRRMPSVGSGNDYKEGFDAGFASAKRMFQERGEFESRGGSRHAELARAEGLRSQMERAPSRFDRKIGRLRGRTR